MLPSRVELGRFAGSGEKICCHAQMSSRPIRTFCELFTDCERLLERAMTEQGPSARADDRILKRACTVADIEETANIEPKHIGEAIQYPSLNRTYWAYPSAVSMQRSDISPPQGEVTCWFRLPADIVVE
jgi:magnesium chelatase family protein